MDIEPGNALESEWTDRPWQSESVLRKLYIDEGKSSHEIANQLGCIHPTILNWMERFYIPTRNQAEATSTSTRREYASYQFTTSGYERWVSYHDGDQPKVLGHQLLACLDHDSHEVFSPSTNVHHVTGNGLDNRPEAVEVVSIAEHNKRHGNTSISECKLTLLQTAATMEEERA